jgi:hypothetical protein
MERVAGRVAGVVVEQRSEPVAVALPADKAFAARGQGFEG